MPINLRKGNCDFDCFKLNCVYIMYLGISFDGSMRWKTQINLIMKRFRKLFNLFKELNLILDLFTLRSVYFALMQSGLSYGIILWESANLSTIN